MIRGIHGLFYTSQPDEARAFVRDKLQLSYTDIGGGWLIFDLPEAEVGFHPTDNSKKLEAGTAELSFYCDEIERTVGALKKRGVIFDQEITQVDFGRITYFRIPGGVKVMLYEPSYEARRTITKVKRRPSKTKRKR